MNQNEIPKSKIREGKHDKKKTIKNKSFKESLDKGFKQNRDDNTDAKSSEYKLNQYLKEENKFEKLNYKVQDKIDVIKTDSDFDSQQVFEEGKKFD